MLRRLANVVCSRGHAALAESFSRLLLRAPDDERAAMSLFYACYRHHLFVCSMLLTLVLYAMLLTAHGMATPRFVLTPETGGIQHASGFSLRKVSDVLAGRKYAVLTFDDGPYGEGLDEQILATLQKHHAHAVFFLVCSHINEATRGELAKFENAGDLIGNQTYDHPNLAKLAQPEIRQQIESCNQRITEVTGKRPTYFRPPFGSTTPAVGEVAKSLGMQQMLWNANSEDSWIKQPEQIRDFSVSQTEDQSILLMHEKPTTAAALDGILTQLEQRGFQFVLPDQLSDNVAIN
jgi:peptidoglycan/xylan/chitin deacetylase (PgdA/CDA1 family)